MNAAVLCGAHTVTEIDIWLLHIVTLSTPLLNVINDLVHCCLRHLNVLKSEVEGDDL